MAMWDSAHTGVGDDMGVGLALLEAGGLCCVGVSRHGDDCDL